MANTYSRFAYRRAGQADGSLSQSCTRLCRDSEARGIRFPPPLGEGQGGGQRVADALRGWRFSLAVQFQRGAAVNSSGSAVVLLICSIEKADETPDSCAVRISFL